MHGDVIGTPLKAFVPTVNRHLLHRKMLQLWIFGA